MKKLVFIGSGFDKYCTQRNEVRLFASVYACNFSSIHLKNCRGTQRHITVLSVRLRVRLCRGYSPRPYIFLYQLSVFNLSFLRFYNKPQN